jgi:hypothetical protein
MKLENRYSESVIERGEGYLNSVKYCIKVNNFIYGKVEGSRTYKTEVDLETLDGDCSCPYGTNCKHAIALYLNYKKGKYSDAEDFIKSLSKMSVNELKELILSKLQENPEWIIKHNIRKNRNTKDFIKSFKKSFSSEIINEADALIPNLSFQQLFELHDYIYNNYDDLAEKLGEESEEDNYREDYWDDEEYDKGLYELNEKLIEIIVKKSLEKDKVNEIIKRDSLRDEIINQAESFKKYKDKIRKEFSKDEYLEFLLNLKNPDILEVKLYVDKSNKSKAYDFIKGKPKFIKELAKAINDKTLTFSVAVYEKDFNNIVKNFDRFENAIKEYYDLNNQLSDIVDLFIKNKFRNEEIAKKFLSSYENTKYNNKQLYYLASQIDDYEFIKSNFDKDKIETHIKLLERMSQIDKENTFKFIKNKKDLLNRHWSYITPLFNFLKKVYNKDEIQNYIKENQESFRTSSHLKKHLKDECGIFISQKEGKLMLEIR